MKIEKITENKIRIILKKEDFKDKNITLQTILNKAEDSQKFFLEILNQAQKEIDFSVDGHKLLIEGFSSDNELFIFTITKYIDKTTQLHEKSFNSNKKNLTIRRKNEQILSSNQIYKFNDFEEFCTFCNFIQNIKPNLKNLYKKAILYLYNDTYFLALSGINIAHPYLDVFSSYIIEFGIKCYFSKNFETKLQEHGTIVIKKNALNIGIKYFAKN